VRSILLFLGAVIVLSIAFGVYIYFQPSVSDTRTTSKVNGNPASRPSESNVEDGSFHAGQGAWMQEFDENTGNIKSEFRASKYDRQTDDTVKVTDPEAHFFLGDGKVGTRRKVVVVGKTGDVVMASNKNKPKLTGGNAQMPSHGLLHDVIIYMYPNENSDEIEMTATMNNAAFDNDTFRIYTEPYIDSDGKKVAGEWVPVVVRGKDYDYDGFGLIMHMDELDKQIRRLEIVHGKQLTIKNASALPGVLGQPEANSANAGPLPWMLAATDNSAAGPLLGSKFRDRNKRRPPKVVATTQVSTGAYRTTFYDDVHVVQGPDGTIEAERMEVDFLMKQSGDKSATQKSPTTKTVSRSTPAPVTNPAQPPTAGGVSKVEASKNKPGTVATKPTSKKSAEPVVVTWTGKMVMVPVDEDLDNDESIVRFYGQPVVVKQKTSVVHCADLAYNSLDEVVLMHEGNGAPVTLTDAHGKTVTTPLLRYSTPDHLATLTGKSSVVSPVSDATGKKTGEMTARWTNDCDMEFAAASGAGAGQDMVIQRVSMHGDVDVQHPKLSMKAQSLDLGFDPSAPKPKKSTTKSAKPASGPMDDLGGNAALRTVDAAGNVDCIIREAQGNRSIDCQKLHLITDQTADGSIAAKSIDAAGDVHAIDNDRDLRAQSMQIWLTDKKPATKESVPSEKSNDRELEKLIARKDVVVTRKDGSVVTGDELFVEMQNGQPHVLVTSDKQASVSNPTSKLMGNWIELWRGDQRGIVKGPGRMIGTMKQTATSPGRPMDVTWTDGVLLDGTHDRIYVNGGVNILSTDSNGANNTAQSAKMVLFLGKMPEKPTTQPAAATSKPTTKRSKKSADDQVDFLAGKDVTQVQLLEKVKVDSILGDDKGNLVRQVSIRSEELDYDRLTDTTTIPQAGRLLFVDLKPTTRPATANAAGGETQTMASSKGNTAMRWSKSLVYDEKNHLSTMTGDVVVKHLGLKNGDDYDLSADKIVTELADSRQPRASGPVPTTKNSDDIGTQVRKVTAEGNVAFAAKGKTIDAATVEYDPSKEILTAAGADRALAEVFTAAGEPQGRFAFLRYDVRNGKIDELKDFRGTARVREKIQPGDQSPPQPLAPTEAPSLLPKQQPYSK
jgi:lipopolysaccharide export system protein LptA